MRGWLLALALLLPGVAAAQMVVRDGVTLTAAQEAKAEDIGSQLRCLVCQNESIEGSGAALAKQLRVIIREQVVAGAGRRSVMDYMVRRYGEFVLLKPPVSPQTWLLYASPVLAVLAGVAAAVLGRRGQKAPAPLSVADKARLDELLR